MTRRVTQLPENEHAASLIKRKGISIFIPVTMFSLLPLPPEPRSQPSEHPKGPKESFARDYTFWFQSIYLLLYNFLLMKDHKYDESICRKYRGRFRSSFSNT